MTDENTFDLESRSLDPAAARALAVELATWAVQHQHDLPSGLRVSLTAAPPTPELACSALALARALAAEDNEAVTALLVDRSTSELLGMCCALANFVSELSDFVAEVQGRPVNELYDGLILRFVTTLEGEE